MKASRTFWSLSALVALAVSAFAAQTASAQTWYECAPGAKPGVFKDAHCKEKTNPAEGFVHIKLPANTLIPVTWSNLTTGTERSIVKLKSVQSGVTLELQATEAAGTGEIQNREEGETTWGEGSGVLTYKNVTVTAPAGKGCKVAGGTITSKKLAATTKGLTNQIKFSPFEGTTFTEVTIEGCSVAALNHVYPVTGSIIGNTEGTTTNLTHTATTTQGTLFFFGQKVGIEVQTTLKRSSTGNGVALT